MHLKYPKKNGWEGSLDLHSDDFYGIFENYPILDKNDKSETFLKTSFFIQSDQTFLVVTKRSQLF